MNALLFTPLAALAHALLAGDTPDDRADSKADWLAAAQRAVDGDTADLEYFRDRAARYDEFEEWAERFDPAANYSFDDWFNGMAPMAASFGAHHLDSPRFGSAWA